MYTLVVQVIETIETILSLFIIFFTKTFHAHKKYQNQQNDFHSLKFLNAQKSAAFVVFCSFIFVCECFFLCVNSF